MPDTAASLVVMALLGVFFMSFPNAYAPAAILLLGVPFFLIVSGCSLFGLLTNRAARRLGEVSYGVYLLQGIVLTVVALLPPLRTFAVASPLHHWVMVLLEAIALVLFAMLAHVAIERPGIQLGRRVASQIESVRTGNLNAVPNPR
jgi:peptidoglycan/LPS O-acetylase OafA/YrhL